MQTRRIRLTVLAELLVIIWMALAVQPEYRDFSPDVRIRGSEYSYLINSGVFAGDMLARFGRIPFWNPLMGVAGEPLLENPFSFALNPFMSVPIFLFGAVNGAKVGVLLHMIGMGLGGWLLGYMLRLSWPGRMLLGLLLVGSGSFAAPIGQGFYQMSLSQAYVPWIMAGLVGTLHRTSRWPVALLVISSALMVFSGTFWYVLPAGAAALLIVAYSTIRLRNWRFIVDETMLRRVGVAAAFLIGLSAVRLLPQAIHSNLVEHALASPDPVHPFGELVLRFFTAQPSALLEFANDLIHFHYVLPLLFAILIGLGRGLLALRRWPHRPERQIIAPGIVAFFLFTLWGQGQTTILHTLQDLFPLLREWRFVTRILAAASPWLIIVAACWFDDILRYLSDQAQQYAGKTDWVARASRWTATGLTAFFVICGGLSVLDVSRNWLRVTGTESTGSSETSALRYLREQQPGKFLTVLGDGFFAYLPFYETLTRASFGNPDYRPGHLPNTLGPEGFLEFRPQYRIGFSDFFPRYMAELGYEPLKGAPTLWDGTTVLWQDQNAPDYAFIVSQSYLESRGTDLTRSDTLPVNYAHRIDQIQVEAVGYPPTSVVVVQEMAYPGWEVTVNGEKFPLEVVGGRIGVLLPPNSPLPGDRPTIIEFNYRPVWLWVGAFLALFAAVALAAYTLRAEGRFVALLQFGLASALKLPKLPRVQPVAQPAQPRPLPAPDVAAPDALPAAPAVPTNGAQPAQPIPAQAGTVDLGGLQSALDRQSEQIGRLADQIGRLAGQLERIVERGELPGELPAALPKDTPNDEV